MKSLGAFECVCVKQFSNNYAPPRPPLCRLRLCNYHLYSETLLKWHLLCLLAYKASQQTCMRNRNLLCFATILCASWPIIVHCPQVQFLTKELGFDAAYNYKTTPHMEALDKMCPNGIDMWAAQDEQVMFRSHFVFIFPQPAWSVGIWLCLGCNEQLGSENGVWSAALQERDDLCLFANLSRYYDNVGGETLEAAIEKCNSGARIVSFRACLSNNSLPLGF